MFRKISLIAIGLILTIGFSVISADEGMWPLYELDKLPYDKLRAGGLLLEPEQIYNPKSGGVADAVVRIGATGSFVSTEGLIITNHHVAQRAIQRQSTIENNYLIDGFYASNKEKEIEARGYSVYVTHSSEDVTLRVLGAVSDGLSDRERYQAIEEIIKKIVKESEEGKDVKCSVAKMYDGEQYVLYTYFKIRDIRIVYVPPDAIGVYGGDIDNWMWPRHTGDFAFMRAYVAPDGSSAGYAEENVPYNPEVFLPISSTGIKDGDFAMMIGFPGRTKRFTDSYDVENMTDYYYPSRIKIYEDILAIMENAALSDPDIEIKLASSIAGYNNALKNSYATINGFERAGVVAKKKEDDRQLTEFLNADQDLATEYGYILPELDSLYKSEMMYREKELIMKRMIRACDLLDIAADLHKLSIERAKEDMDRERGYQDRDTISNLQWLRVAQSSLVPEIEKKILSYFIRRALELPVEQKIEAITDLFAGLDIAERNRAIDRFLDELYDKTIIIDPDQRINMFYMTESDLENLNVPLLNFAFSLRPEIDELDERSKEVSGALQRLRPKLIQAYRAWKRDAIYPDANGTKRFNYGWVKGYRPRDAVEFDYITSLGGVMEKETGADPFIVPPELKETYLKQDFGKYIDSHLNDVPINFLTTNDGTGGNSGSPIINGKGELIGLDFDTNFESVVSDYLYDTRTARSIVVDIRYVLFIIDKVYHLDNLFNELTIH